MPSPILIALLAVVAAAGYFLFGRKSSEPSSSTAPGTPANGVAKAGGVTQSGGRDFVKAMELAVSAVRGG